MKLNFRWNYAVVFAILLTITEVGCTTSTVESSTASPTILVVSPTQELIEVSPSPTVEAATATPTTEATSDPTSTPEPTAEPTVEAAPDGGFLDGTVIDVDTLPELLIPPTGIAGICAEVATEPQISVSRLTSDKHRLCIYHWPIIIGEPNFRVDLVDPAGTAYSETYAFADSGSRIEVIDSSGQPAGFVYEGGPGQSDQEPVVSISLYTNAGIPTGTWTATATALDGTLTVGPTPLDIRHGSPTASAIVDSTLTILQPQPIPFSVGQTASIVGAEYTPNTLLVVVLYAEDPANPSSFGTPTLLPIYATSVQIDAKGSFSADFLIGGDAPSGSYHIIAEPQITPDLFINPFSGLFTIE